MASDILATLSKIRQDPNLTKQFVNDPAATLRTLGVDPTQYNVQKVEAPQGASQEAVAAGAADVSVCGSIGCVVCGSVG